MSQHWAPKQPKSRSRLDQEADQEADQPEQSLEEPGEAPVLHDDFGEVCLAEALGVKVEAEVVQPVPESQVPPDSFTFELGGCHTSSGMEESTEALDTLPYVEPVGDTYIDPVTPTAEKESLEITPTEMEVTPPAPSPVEIVDSPPKPSHDMVVPSGKPKTESLEDVRKKIELLKHLS